VTSVGDEAFTSSKAKGSLLALLPPDAWTDDDEQTMGWAAQPVHSMIELMSVAETMRPALIIIDAGQIDVVTAAWLVHLRQIIPATVFILTATCERFEQAAFGLKGSVFKRSIRFSAGVRPPTGHFGGAGRCAEQPIARWKH